MPVREVSSWRCKPIGQWQEQDQQGWSTFVENEHVFHKLEEHVFSCLGRKFKNEYRAITVNFYCYESEVMDTLFVAEASTAGELLMAGYFLHSAKTPEIRIEPVFADEKQNTGSLNKMQKRALFPILLRMLTHVKRVSFYETMIYGNSLNTELDSNVLEFLDVFGRKQEFFETVKTAAGQELFDYYQNLVSAEKEKDGNAIL